MEFVKVNTIVKSPEELAAIKARIAFDNSRKAAAEARREKHASVTLGDVCGGILRNVLKKG